MQFTSASRKIGAAGKEVEFTFMFFLF